MFPALLEGLGDAPLDRVRVHAHDGRLRIWQEVGRNVEKVYDGAVTEVERDGRHRRSPFTALLADGQSITFTPSGHCGCGSPLRRMRIDEDA